MTSEGENENPTSTVLGIRIEDGFVVQHNNRIRIKSESGRYRWEACIIPYIIGPLLRIKNQKGSGLTIRGLCYILESMKVIPKTEEDFRKVYEAMASARKNGTLDRDAFIDNTRYTLGNFNKEYVSVKDQINNAVDLVQKLTFTDLGRKYISRWHKQRYYVEAWVEKDSFAGVLEIILLGRDITIAVNRGWPSITFLQKNMERLYSELGEMNDTNEGSKFEFYHSKIQVLYFGDLDPSGWAMDKHFEKEFKNWFSSRVKFKRVAITRDQLDKFDLKNKTNPNLEVRKKLENNKNAESFKKDFGSLFQIELEAIESLPGFEELVKREVDELYNNDKYQEILKLPENDLTVEQRKNFLKEILKKQFHFD